ncbi:MAG: hypothetical protein GXZ08_04705, partial [Tissierellia bacterium]|nr:hypothetical protein [Tissierellia bacterium]
MNAKDMNAKDRGKELFDALRKENPKINIDGVVNEEKYHNSKYKIIYIMKEVNSGEGLDLRKGLNNGGRAQTWNNTSRWTEGILNLEKEYLWDELEKNNEERRDIFLKKIGVINLKKTAGGHTSIN